MCDCRRCRVGLAHLPNTTSAYARVQSLIEKNEQALVTAAAAQKTAERQVRKAKEQINVIQAELDELRTAARVLNPRK